MSDLLPVRSRLLGEEGLVLLPLRGAVREDLCERREGRWKEREQKLPVSGLGLRVGFGCSFSAISIFLIATVGSLFSLFEIYKDFIYSRTRACAYL